jgi:hypothetical protein
MPLSGIQNFSRLEAGFPIRIASGMTVLGTGERFELIKKTMAFEPQRRKGRQENF